MEKSAPFVHPVPQQSPNEKWKIALLSFTLLPFRMVWAIISVLFVYTVCVITSILIRNIQENKLSHFESKLLNATRIIIRVASQVGLRVLGFTYKETGTLDSRAHTIVANHLSYLDILFFMSRISPSFVAKSSVANVPFIGVISKVLQSVFTSHIRDNTTSNISGAQQIIDRQKLMESYPQFPSLVIFPEGTTTNGRFVIHFRKGAFISGLPVQPIALRFHYSHFSPTWETIPFTVHVFQLATQFLHSLEVVYLPVYFPSEEEKKNPQLFADNVQQVIANALNIPTSTYTVEDKVAFHKYVISQKVPWNDLHNKKTQ